MNRIIQYRGVRIYNKELVYGDLVHGVGLKSNKLFILPDAINLASIVAFDPLDGCEIYPDTACLFTRSIDKNGKPIFEGDIIKGTFTPWPSGNYHGSNYKTYEVIASIVWHNNGLCCFNLRKGNAKKAWVHKSIIAIDNIEVIGNIYQNPDLLSPITNK